MALVTRKRVETVLVGLVALSLGILALIHRGVPAADVDLNDGGVWVTNQTKRLVGHLNHESQTIDGALRPPSSSFGVTQSAGNVLVRSSDTVHPVDVASLTFLGEAGVAGVLTAHGGNEVLFADQSEGRVWATDTRGAASFSLTADPLLKGLDTPRIAVGVEGTGYVLTADGQLYTVTGSGDQAVTRAQGRKLEGRLSDSAQLTVVGDKIVVLDGTTLTIDGHPVTNDGFAGGVLQQPSGPSGTVVVATPSELLKVDISSGQVTRESIPNGKPAAPVQLEGCTYALWAESGYYVRDCGGDDYERAQHPELAAAKQPVFRANRKVIVINDEVTGDVFLPLKQMVKVNNWEQVESQLVDEKQDKESEETDKSQTREFSEEQHPPQAVDDELGARPGTATVLPVLSNDIDLDGDVLTAIIRDVPSGVKISQAKEGRALRIEVPADAKDTITFTYQAFDGVDVSNVATVKVNIRAENENSAPHKIRDSQVNLSERASAGYSVLADWVDPDGDPIYLQQATVEDDSLEMTWRPDGYVSVKDLGKGGPGRRSVNLTVSDGRDAASGELAAQISPGSTNSPPVANNDHYVATVGHAITLDPRSNDTDSDSDSLKLVEVSAAPDGVELKPDYQAGTIRFTASKAGNYTLVYGITDGPNNAKGRIRVDVIDPNSSGLQPVPENDLGLLPANGSLTINALDNDFDPAGGVLAIQGVSQAGAPGLNIEVIKHSLLRVTAPAGIDSPQSFTYTVSNGHASATAKVLVIPKEPPSTVQSPVAAPDSSVVRVGDLVTVPVLSNDYSPADLDISLSSDLDVRSDPSLGEFFVSNGAIRFRAGSEAGTAEAIYTVRDSQGNPASTTVTVNIRAKDEHNEQPTPKQIDSRTFAGSSVRIPVPLDGIDPDGDSVTLGGLGSQVPKLGAVKVEGNYLVYDASKGASGTDTFTYRVLDRFGAEGEGLIRVGVVPPPAANQAPVAVADEVAARPSTRLEISALANDIDPDGDQLQLVKGSAAATDDSWDPKAQTRGQRIVVVTPAQEGIYHLYYTITDGGGVSDRGVVTVRVASDVPPKAPVANDDVVPTSAIAGVDQVEVPVLENDSDPDGVVSDLKVTAESPATVKGGTVTVPLADDRQIVLYTVTDSDGLSSRAAIVVPGREAIPPAINTGRGQARVKAGEPLTIRFTDWVVTRPGRTARLTSVDSVVAGPGGSPEVGNNGVRVIDDQTIEFTPAKNFSGQTTVSFEVTDGGSMDDSTALKSKLSLSVIVEGDGQQPPQLRPTQLRVAPDEAPQKISLSNMVSDPNPGDNDTMSYSLVSTDGPVQASVSGQELSVSVPKGTPVGSTGSIVVQVHDGSTDPVNMTIPVTVIASTRPPMTISEIVERDGRVGNTASFDLTRWVTNPFADTGGEITLVGSPQVRGSATVTSEGNVINVTPTDSGTGADTVDDVLVTFRVADATKDPSRERTGVIRVVVKDVPRAPTAVTAQYAGSQTARVSWTHSGWRGATPKGFTVFWQGGSKNCGLQTTCDIPGLANSGRYTFTVKAEVAEGDLNSRSPRSEPSNEILVDALPSKPSAPTAAFGDQQIALTWEAATVPGGGSPVTRYTVTMYPGGQKQETTATSLTWTGLTNGQAYTFTVTAHNRLTDENSQLTPPTSDESRPETPAGAPSNQGAPTVSMDSSSSSLKPRANIKWSPPGNPNGDSNFRYVVTDANGKEVCPEQQDTSCTTPMDPSTETVTFSVRSTNKSGKWSAASPASNAVRAFQPPGAPSGFSLRPTGKGSEVEFSFGAASGNGVRADEITYRWSAGSQSGTVKPGRTVVSSPAFQLGQAVTVRLVAVANVLGQTSEGEAATATVTAYGPPQAPVVNSEPGVDHVTLRWQVPGSSNGARVKQVEITSTVKAEGRNPSVETWTTTDLSGSVDKGNDRKQNVCVKARTQNEHGDWSDYSAESCASTWGDTKATLSKGDSVECPDGGGRGCNAFKVTLQNWQPGGRVKCEVPNPADQEDVAKVKVGPVDASGNASRQFSDWVFPENYNVPSEGFDITARCR